VSNIADEVLRGLSAQGEDAEKRDPWLIKLLLKKIDRETQQVWAEYSNKETFPSFQCFLSFINDRCDALERVPAYIMEKTGVQKSKVSHSHTAMFNLSCTLCENSHYLGNCSKFRAMDVSKRFEFVKQKQLCYNCLQANHNIKKCPSKKSCSTCGKRHHTQIHLETQTLLSCRK